MKTHNTKFLKYPKSKTAKMRSTLSKDAGAFINYAAVNFKKITKVNHHKKIRWSTFFTILNGRQVKEETHSCIRLRHNYHHYSNRTSSVDYANNPYDTSTSALLKLYSSTTLPPPESILPSLYTVTPPCQTPPLDIFCCPFLHNLRTADPPTITTQSRPKDLHFPFLVLGSAMAGSRESLQYLVCLVRSCLGRLTSPLIPLLQRPPPSTLRFFIIVTSISVHRTSNALVIPPSTSIVQSTFLADIHCMLQWRMVILTIRTGNASQKRKQVHGTLQLTGVPDSEELGKYGLRRLNFQRLDNPI
ncbi:hypothetical protein C0J52_02167 [Blattella germanica]|nr:hypothetical protein C0J52_02167 [Blattella germanica]